MATLNASMYETAIHNIFVKSILSQCWCPAILSTNFLQRKHISGQNKVLAAANLLGKQQGLSVPNWVPKQPATGIASIENNNT